MKRGQVFILLAVLSCSLAASTARASNLSVTPLTWNVIGLDSNDVSVGPNDFPVGVRVCNNAGSPTTGVMVNFVWDSANAYINLRPGSNGSAGPITIPSLAAGACTDVYFEVVVTRTSLAYDTTRRYHVTATDLSGMASSPTPRELYVEHLISQNRNSITSVQYGPNFSSLTPVAFGGSMNLVVGNTYAIRLTGGTATQGYNQFTSFINLPNTIFQINSVSQSYSADNSPFVPNPVDKLYGDACLWDNDPTSPTYLSCVGGDYKAGGATVVTDYLVTIISGGGTSQTLNTLLDDFSGSSYHYNSDFSTGFVIANISDPSLSTIAKSFMPATTTVGGVSVLTVTITNPNPGSVGGYSVVDNLPAGMTIASPSGLSSSGCGSPTLTGAAGAGSFSISNGTIAANGTCIVSVNVTPSSATTYVNTTQHLFANLVDTGKTATANLVVSSTPPPPPPLCGFSMATWDFGTYTANPPLPSFQAADVATAAVTAGQGLTIAPDAGSQGGNPIPGVVTYGWQKNPPIVTTTSAYIQFAIDTSNYTGVTMQFDAIRKSNGPNNDFVYYSTNGTAFTQLVAANFAPTTNWATFGPFDFTGLTNTTGITYFRIYGYGANATTVGNNMNFDNVLFTGCKPATPPTIVKSFSPNPVAVDSSPFALTPSTLTFVLTNPNPATLTGVKFTDALPSGLQVAATPAASTTCGGTPSWAPTAGSTTLNFGQTTGATIPANSSCNVLVNITATTAGAHLNVSGSVSSTNGGTNSGSTGFATAVLNAILPPVISKEFSPNPILAPGPSTLTFTISNPNAGTALTGVAFSDTLPTSPAAMTVANPQGATVSGCGSPTFAPAVGATTLSFTGGTLAAGGTCTVTVNVTASVAGTYSNTSGNVSHQLNSQTVPGNTASDSLTLNPAQPAISLLKQVGPSATGPWSPFIAVQVGAPVYYQFTVENTGNVPLGPPITITDNTLNVSACNAMWTTTVLPVAVPANNNHIVTCVVGPITAVAGSHTNTAFATGTYIGNPYNSANSSATYATTDLTLVKSAVLDMTVVAPTNQANPGDTITYSFSLHNSGAATLTNLVVTDPLLPSLVCTLASLAPGATAPCSVLSGNVYILTAGDISAGFVTNKATATDDQLDVATSRANVPLTGGSPTAIRLRSFEAARDGSDVELTWKTGYEVSNLGFRIYREVDGTRSLITPGLVAGSALSVGLRTELASGRSYHWFDFAAPEGAIYILEEVDLNGTTELHGPIVPSEVGFQRDVPREGSRLALTASGKNSPTLAELARAAAEAGDDPSPAGFSAASLSPQETSGGLRLEASNVSPLAGKSSAQSRQLVLASQAGMRILVRQKGWYRVSHQDLVNAGWDPGISPTNLQLYVEGNPVPMLVTDLGGGNYTMEFYGTGLDLSWTDTRVYWLASSTTAGTRLTSEAGASGASAPADFPFTVQRKNHTVYFSTLTTNGDGDNWFGPLVGPPPGYAPANQSMIVSNLNTASSASATLTVALQGITSGGVTHYVDVTVNGTLVGTVTFADQSYFVGSLSFLPSLLNDGVLNSILLSEEGQELSLVSSVALTYPHLYKADQNALEFTVSGGKQIAVSGFAISGVRVFDVTNPSAVSAVASSVGPDGSGGFALTLNTPAVAGTLRYLALADDRIASPWSVQANNASSLNKANNKADLVIISHSSLIPALAPLQALRQAQGLATQIIDVTDVYDEFNFGEKSPYAIKAFLQYAATKWKTHPRYALLVGDASTDQRNYLGWGDFDLVPTKEVPTVYLKTASDDWFVDFNNDTLPELPIGRLPVRTLADANTVIAKIVGYDSAPPSNGVYLIADSNDDNDFVGAVSNLVPLVGNGFTVPQAPDAPFLSVDAVGAGAAHAKIIDAFNSGQALIEFVGHGSETIWSKSFIFESSDVVNLTNSGQLPVVIAMDCLNGAFQDVFQEALAKTLLKASNGGAVAVWASSSLTQFDSQIPVNEALFQQLFGGNAPRIGDAMVTAKYATTDSDVRRTWILFGDPTMKLK